MKAETIWTGELTILLSGEDLLLNEIFLVTQKLVWNTVLF